MKHVAIGNPLALNIANTLFVARDVEVTTKDGISAEASAVSFTKLRRGKAIYGRDYFFDPTFLERIWGRVDEASAATTEPAIREPAVPASVA